jgi:hypothetical protein
MNYCPRCGDPLATAGGFSHYCPSADEIKSLTSDLRAGKIKLLRYGKPCRVLYRPMGGTMTGSDEEEREFREQQNKPVPVDLFGCCEPE